MTRYVTYRLLRFSRPLRSHVLPRPLKTPIRQANAIASPWTDRPLAQALMVLRARCESGHHALPRVRTRCTQEESAKPRPLELPLNSARPHGRIGILNAPARKTAAATFSRGRIVGLGPCVSTWVLSGPGGVCATVAGLGECSKDHGLLSRTRAELIRTRIKADWAQRKHRLSRIVHLLYSVLIAALRLRGTPITYCERRTSERPRAPDPCGLALVPRIGNKLRTQLHVRHPQWPAAVPRADRGTYCRYNDGRPHSYRQYLRERSESNLVGSVRPCRHWLRKRRRAC
ncbi:hypothetical protein C8Q80DRAFT_559755 [Daedaleopsis nitida]|nr:hypothetical protein C8Q80DRAFT_559755 [Daedaleopsis nitida]